jgi:Plasmid encoded RepA protein
VAKKREEGQLTTFEAPLTSRRGRPPARLKFLGELTQSQAEGVDALREFAELTANLHSGLCQTALPHSRPADDSAAWERQGLTATLIVEPGFVKDSETGKRRHAGVPYGTKARLVLIYIQTLGVNDPVVPLGDSMSAWIRSLGLSVSGGPRGNIGELKEQILRLANCSLKIETTTQTPDGLAIDSQRALIADGLRMWADRPGQEAWPKVLHLDQKFFEHLRENAVALDRRAIAELSSHALGLDLYASLAHWLPRLRQPLPMFWQQLVKAFGSENEPNSEMSRRVRQVLPRILSVYPNAKVDIGRHGLLLRPSMPAVKQTRIGWTGVLQSLPARADAEDTL